MVKNWKYFQMGDEIGNLKITRHQYMTGNILGIIAEKQDIKYSQGNLLNAKTFDIPIRIKLVDLYTGHNENEIKSQIKSRIEELELEGCRCILSSGGNLGRFDKQFHEGDLMALSTPLLILDFVLSTIADDLPICIVSSTDYSNVMDILNILGFDSSVINRCIITDLNQKIFYAKGVEIEKPSRIGAYIWDSIEDYHYYLKVCREPIYDSIKVSKFLCGVVTQKPYEGII